MPVGRPSIYSEQIAAEICNRIALGESLIKICKDDHMPNRDTVRMWVIEKSDFSVKYARAREDQQDSYSEEILEIADDRSCDVVYEEILSEGKVIKRIPHSDNTAVQRHKLMVDSRKWIMSKLLPKKYGDKITQELTGVDGGPAILQIITKTAKE